ncbi:MAG: 3-oxoacyl-[acyl-carrier-protein] reductase [Candidatus Berkelbacteria bacterium]|nr:3-oxoacyl-[acyl-carrier-protein] reductase [Candidatus Berkelbacteria bacterium]
MDGAINVFSPNSYKEKVGPKVAVVTGSSSGIGRAIVLKLAKDGFDVVVNSASDSKKGEGVAREIKKIGRSAIYIEADVSDEMSVEQMIEKTIKKFGKIDLLVNNAGITRDKKLENMSKEDWDKVIAVNLTGVFNCTKSAISYMQKEGSGKIINIASVVGEMGNFGQANYSASKGGIIALTKTVARENAGDNILVNAIAPGFIKTKMVEAIPKSIIKKVIEQIPMGRLGEPEEVANFVAFLASDKAGYITGQVFNINGGLYM